MNGKILSIIGRFWVNEQDLNEPSTVMYVPDGSAKSEDLTDTLQEAFKLLTADSRLPSGRVKRLRVTVEEVL